MAPLSRRYRRPGSSRRRQRGRSSSGNSGSAWTTGSPHRTSGGPSSAIASTTKKESWKLAWNSCRGSHTRISRAEPASELTRLPGRRNAQPRITTVIMSVDRIADGCQPVAAV